MTHSQPTSADTAAFFCGELRAPDNCLCRGRIRSLSIMCTCRLYVILHSLWRGVVTRVIVGDQIDFGEMRAGCTCLRARRITRQLTQIYDRALETAGLSVNQFGILANLHGQGRVAIGALAELVGKHPSTLNRDLKPLQARNLVTTATDPADRRVHLVFITRKGRAKLRKAVPFWRRAQAQIQEVLGVETTLTLNGLLDLASAKLAR
jgi:DNA-binding MarR family transcriptional regulator